MNRTLIFILPALSILPLSAFALSGKEIMTRNEEARKVNEFEARSKLSTGNNKDSSSKIKEFSFWRKVQPDGVHNSTFTRFHSPAEVRNEGILIVENGSGKNDVLLYLPAYKKIRRVESQQQSGSFMGSVFSYSDIATPHVDEYQYSVLKDESCPTKEAVFIKCHVVEAVPANDDVKERTGYTKSVAWVRQDNFMVVKGEYYNLEGTLFKRLEANEIKLVDPKGKKWLSHLLFIENLKTGDFTRLEFSKVKVNGGIPNAIFTQQNLQKVN
jgi:hypothetical protein